MKITFLGTGEAFDETNPNNSSLVETSKTKLLLDCGFTVPTQIWKYHGDKDLIDAIYISHQHGDHFSGLPALLLRIWEEGRKKDLTIICQKEFKEKFQEFMDFVYRGFMDKFNYNINLIEAVEGKKIKFNDLDLYFEKTIHSGENLAVKVVNEKNSFCYCGDGSPIENSDFYNNSDLLILETYLYDIKKIGHSSVVDAISFAEKNNAKCLALTHINRDLRKKGFKIPKTEIKVIIPKPFDEYFI
jgi:ribonuclease Z